MPRIHSPVIVLLVCLALAALPRSGRAHSGPPFPIIVDQRIPGHVISLWTDPDVGEATFFVVAEPDAAAKTAVEIAAVDLWLQPATERLPKVELRGEPMPRRGYVEYTVLPHIDAAELWNVGIVITMRDGTRHTFATEVEATPPGGGPWFLLLYLIPFVLFGGLWAMVFIRRSKRRTGPASPASTAPTDHPTAASPSRREP